MGQSFNFTCPLCKYEAVVSGGRSEGFNVVCETMICNHCKVVTDVVVETRFDHELELGRCIDCEGTDLTPWPDSHPCPRCDGTLAQGDLVVLWD
ncbi:MAG: hypothetical protein ACI9F9_003387 [Candidatus Paceibacteria bacterium]|jgi:hypothetical protein